jgi:hypothetical protein
MGIFVIAGAPDTIRTCDLRLRRANLPHPGLCKGRHYTIAMVTIFARNLSLLIRERAGEGNLPQAADYRKREGQTRHNF